MNCALCHQKLEDKGRAAHLNCKFNRDRDRLDRMMQALVPGLHEMLSLGKIAENALFCLEAVDEVLEERYGKTD